MRALLRRFVPSPIINLRRRWLALRQRSRAMSSMPPQTRKLYADSTKAYAVELGAAVKRIRADVLAAAQRVHGEAWNFYSDALRPEIIDGFVKSATRCPSPARYLEIGSNRGLSMAFIALYLRSLGRLARAVSIDPYFASGYVEGASGPYATDRTVLIDKAVRDAALRLYASFDLSVELLETTSDCGLRQLITDGAQFDLIYIDGSHEGLTPLGDLGMSLSLLSPRGVVILDDHQWPDVAPLKALCDKHAESVCVTWKTAAYRLRQ